MSEAAHITSQAGGAALGDDTPLTETGLLPYLMNALHRRNVWDPSRERFDSTPIETIGQLRSLTKHELLKTHQVGPGAVAAINELLGAAGGSAKPRCCESVS